MYFKFSHYFFLSKNIACSPIKLTERIRFAKFNCAPFLSRATDLIILMLISSHKLKKSLIVGYIGFDPTADSLHIGNLVQIMTLVHFQKCGHKPIILIGGATGMVGDPSGKSKERVLLSEKIINQNIKGIKKQLLKFLDFNCGENSAEIVNNHDWFKDIKILDFM